VFFYYFVIFYQKHPAELSEVFGMTN